MLKLPDERGPPDELLPLPCELQQQRPLTRPLLRCLEEWTPPEQEVSLLLPLPLLRKRLQPRGPERPDEPPPLLQLLQQLLNLLARLHLWLNDVSSALEAARRRHLARLHRPAALLVWPEKHVLQLHHELE